MFKGKVYYYSNINWKEKKLEKDFNNFEEYNNFLNSHPEFSPNNLLSFDLDNYLENFFNSRFALETPYSNNNEEKKLLPEWINLDEYEREAKKIDEEKRKKKEEKWVLEKTLEKLKGYLEKFKKENRNDLVEKIKEDIKKVEEKLKNLI